MVRGVSSIIVWSASMSSSRKDWIAAAITCAARGPSPASSAATAVAGASRHADMDRTVGLHEALGRRGVVEVGRRIEKGPQAGELSALDVPGRGGGCGWLEYQAQIVDLAHIAQRQRGDHMSAAWPCEHEPLHPQAGQRGPGGGLGEAEALDKLHFGNWRIRREFGADDGATKALVGGRT